MTIHYEHLIGLGWEHRTRDCYALVRDFYRDNWGIILGEYDWPDRWWVDRPELDLFYRHFRDEGFAVITPNHHFEMRPGDGLLIARGSTVASHCGVWLGGNRFLHHPYMGLSTTEVWAGKWSGATLTIVRHHQVPPPAPAEKINILDLAPAHVRNRIRAATP